MSEKPLENDLGFNRQSAEYSARQMDKLCNYRIGEMWDIKYLDSRDDVHHFATVLKIDDNNYRFFHSKKEANVQRVLRGLPDVPMKVKYNTAGIMPFK